MYTRKSSASISFSLTTERLVDKRDQLLGKCDRLLILFPAAPLRHRGLRLRARAGRSVRRPALPPDVLPALARGQEGGEWVRGGVLPDPPSAPLRPIRAREGEAAAQEELNLRRPQDVLRN